MNGIARLAGGVLAGCLTVLAGGCYALETGNLTVIFSDTDGKPITNATVKVRTSKGAFWGRGSESEYFHYEGHSDSNGVASIDFGFRDADFSWRVITPSHYSQEFGSKRECFDNVVEESDYLHVDTNTVEGLARYEEMKKLYYADDAESYIKYLEKLQPKSVKYTDKRIVRSVRFYTKRNPQPMYVHGRWNAISLPIGSKEIITNGNTVVCYPVAIVDIKRHGSRVDDGCTNWYQSADFAFEEFKVVTNGVKTIYGRMLFAPGCGAYRRKKTGDASFPSTYEADVNAHYESELSYLATFNVNDNVIISSQNLLNEDEYMVIRTRMSVDEGGRTNGWHYAKILGPIRIFSDISFDQSVFNPRLNDPNLEFDIDRNLASPKHR